jgi:hypothetical protein
MAIGSNRFSFDANNNLMVTSSGGGSSSTNITQVAGNTIAATTAAALPVELFDGTNPFGTASNPLSVNVLSGGGSNASVGATGTTAPTSATEIGIISSGNLVGVSASTPMPVSATVAANSKTNPLFVSVADGTNALTAALSAYGTPPTGTEVQGVNAYVTNTPTVVQGTAAANTAGWPVTAAGLAESTAAWTSSTSQNTALQVNTAGYTTVAVTLNQGSNLTGGVVTFEVSDTTAFTNAYGMVGQQILVTGTTAPSSTYSLAASTNVAFVFNVAGFAAFRVRLSTAIVGSSTVNVGITSSQSAPPVASLIVNSSGSSVVSRAGTATAPADNIASLAIYQTLGGSNFPLWVGDSIFGGAFSGTSNANLQGWSKRRTPTVFKSVQATASGNTAVWTPGTSNKFRLLKLFVQLTYNASLTTGAVFTITFQDGTTGMPISFDLYVPTVAVTTVIGDGFSQELDLGEFGILSATAGNAFNVNLSATLQTGNVRVISMGTEE